MRQVVRALTAADEGLLGGHHVLICDRDAKWSAPVRPDVVVKTNLWFDPVLRRRCPQGDVGGSPRMDLVRGDDLMLGFLNGDQVPEFVRCRDLAFTDRRGVRLEEAQDFVGHVRVSAQHPGARLCEHPLHEGAHLLQLVLGALQDRVRCRGRRAEALAQSADHRRGIALNRTRRGHQRAIALDQSRSRLGRSRLIPDRQHAPGHTPQPIADPARLIAQRRTRPLHRAGQHAQHTKSPINSATQPIVAKPPRLVKNPI